MNQMASTGTPRPPSLDGTMRREPLIRIPPRPGNSSYEEIIKLYNESEQGIRDFVERCKVFGTPKDVSAEKFSQKTEKTGK